MKQSDFEEKVHELEKALIERRAELGRTKTSEVEEQKLLDIQKRIEALLDDAKRANGEENKQEIVHRANEMLIELRQYPIA
ncbi:hypothetical protein DSM14862_04174 (plasmid) [Sulfitobacter indolifex]|uniref:Uncharacterized protein n=1 Tax=Sulfitobacter indolifex HEL-45 TaxID=391624 RepID=A0ABP2D8F8_9RHOB|nr:hypothetical protein [Sulfitobacter indolifex]EDQ03582.1 hypothetical protein OIHEL45_16461 [Sulfitobacter indolifex HEL-45]UOA21334.1 hypothetical protein DSM14862_04174 [Sulfitobacter indolifex]